MYRILACLAAVVGLERLVDEGPANAFCAEIQPLLLTMARSASTWASRAGRSGDGAAQSRTGQVTQGEQAAHLVAWPAHECCASQALGT
jgi:hypothetical protein